MTIHQSSEAQRNDPELRDKVERVCNAQNAMLLKAAQQLQEIVDEMRVLSGTRDNYSIYDRCYEAVRTARYTVERDADFVNRHGGLVNDTYIGNMAAGQMGDYIKSVDFEARFQGKV